MYDCVVRNTLTSFSLAGACRLRCVPQCEIKNITATKLALDPDSSSTLEICVGVRAEGLRWSLRYIP